MTPVKVSHSAFQGEIGFILRSLLSNGKTLPECAVTTTKGTKVADVAWVSSSLFNRIKDEVECSVAPEICIEVISASNSKKEINEKKHLFMEAGAQEFWVCDEEGQLKFYNSTGELASSLLVPEFPKTITW